MHSNKYIYGICPLREKNSSYPFFSHGPCTFIPLRHIYRQVLFNVFRKVTNTLLEAQTHLGFPSHNFDKYYGMKVANHFDSFER